MLFDVLKSRRSIRRFQSREIEQEKINTILKSALLSPSSRSIRPWEFIAVTDKETIGRLAQSKQAGSQFLTGAPLVVAVIADHTLSDVWVEDASIASTIIQLAAQDLGLGSCWIQIRERAHTEEKTAGDYIKELLGIPEKYSVECLIAIGYPDEEKKPYEEDMLQNQKLHINKF